MKDMTTSDQCRNIDPWDQSPIAALCYGHVAHPPARPAAQPDTTSPMMSLFRTISHTQHHQPDSTIMLHGDAADTIYLIVSGTVRCCTISEEGQRQIFRFARKGELVGIAGMQTWHFTVEAVDHVIVKAIPRALVEHSCADDPSLLQELQAHMCAQLQSREKQLLAFMTTKASVRLFQFLSAFAASRPTADYIALPMCRRDIADHLGMSVETVSRAFSDLKAKGRIDLACAEKFRIPKRAGNAKPATPAFRLA
ncbi:Crp/Fnr family transcriptional regulator [Rhodobacteraceae bacterium KMM 6894]|nr:Crp/Fnr family transcriptional regulator [Rhodobacteraceae bacterium KMM 6894]